MKNLKFLFAALVATLLVVNISYGQRKPTAPSNAGVVIVKPDVDLVVTKSELGPLSNAYLKVIDNKIHVQVRVTYKNIGTTDILKDKRFEVSLQHEHPGGSRQYTQKIASGLNAGKTFTHKFFLKMPAFYSGKTIIFSAYADTYYDIQESDERNNSLSRTLKIPRYTP